MTVVITGGTGTIGKRLSAMLLAKGYDVIVLSRNIKAGAGQSAISYAHWDVAKQEIDVKAITSADYIIHLAGAGVAEGRWTKKRKRQIIDSRTQSSALLVKTLLTNKNNVKAMVSASAIGWYGADTAAGVENGFTEEAKPADDFLGTTCRLWEDSTEPLKQAGIRLVKLRTGIVLSNAGGAYVEFKKPLKAGLATIMGNGKQVVSWIHVDDVCSMYIFAIENAKLSGAFNAVSPKPVSNKVLILQIARQLKGTNYLAVHAPSFALKLLLGEMSVEILKSVTVSAEKIQGAGYRFLYPGIKEAVEALAIEK